MKTSPSQHALRLVNQLFDEKNGGLYLLLLTVIPLPYDPSPSLMKARGRGQTRPQAPTREQCLQAWDVLRRASALLHLYSPDLDGQLVYDLLWMTSHIPAYFLQIVSLQRQSAYVTKLKTT